MAKPANGGAKQLPFTVAVIGLGNINQLTHRPTAALQTLVEWLKAAVYHLALAGGMAPPHIFTAQQLLQHGVKCAVAGRRGWLGGSGASVISHTVFIYSILGGVKQRG
ncbi:hypothetical protein GCM10025791_03950 [Halioxenophilus aromaticivorans]|uniref:Uncharacterized protein n=1 Tax=Halioxenophilus aromaticivorans TaxID=1306992 RepID=A0AAV3TXR9_9ALTE